jgi:hypothetical protein
MHAVQLSFVQFLADAARSCTRLADNPLNSAVKYVSGGCVRARECSRLADECVLVRGCCRHRPSCAVTELSLDLDPSRLTLLSGVVLGTSSPLQV